MAHFVHMTKSNDIYHQYGQTKISCKISANRSLVQLEHCDSFVHHSLTWRMQTYTNVHTNTKTHIQMSCTCASHQMWISLCHPESMPIARFAIGSANCKQMNWTSYELTVTWERKALAPSVSVAFELYSHFRFGIAFDVWLIQVEILDFIGTRLTASKCTKVHQSCGAYIWLD